MHTLNCKGKLLLLDKPVVMGIINVTPDSFYENSRKTSIQECLDQAAAMLSEGASILDIGGQSTRPGSLTITQTEEMDRVLPVIEVLTKNIPGSILSIDTFYAEVAEKAIEAGASMVNDVSGGLFDKDMLAIVGKLKVPYVCMHSKGLQQPLKNGISDEDLLKEILDFFIERIAQCKLNGIVDIIIDPGFGFGKTTEQNFSLLKNIHLFKITEKPILLGVSRKSSIYKTLGITAADALNGTSVLNTLGLLNGASILRVHDVKEAMQAITLLEAYKKCR